MGEISLSLKQKILAFIPYMVSIIVVLLLVLTINHSKDIIIENAQLKEKKAQFERNAQADLEKQQNLEEENRVLVSKNEALTKDIKTSKELLKNINHKYNEKINSVDNLSYSELQEFFTNRYYKGSYPK